MVAKKKKNNEITNGLLPRVLVHHKEAISQQCGVMDPQHVQRIQLVATRVAS
jgi:hypothetical protein